VRWLHDGDDDLPLMSVAWDRSGCSDDRRPAVGVDDRAKNSSNIFAVQSRKTAFSARNGESLLERRKGFLVAAAIG
jgi:hypothetical protein